VTASNHTSASSRANSPKSPHCGEDIPAFTFLSRLQVSHPIYKHLLQHNVTQMSQSYIQLEEAMKISFNHIAKHGDVRRKSKSSQEASAHAQDQNRGQLALTRQVLLILSSNPLQTHKPIE